MPSGWRRASQCQPASCRDARAVQGEIYKATQIARIGGDSVSCRRRGRCLPRPAGSGGEPRGGRLSAATGSQRARQVRHRDCLQLGTGQRRFALHAAVDQDDGRSSTHGSVRMLHRRLPVAGAAASRGAAPSRFPARRAPTTATAIRIVGTLGPVAWGPRGIAVPVRIDRLEGKDVNSEGVRRETTSRASGVRPTVLDSQCRSMGSAGRRRRLRPSSASPRDRDAANADDVESVVPEHRERPIVQEPWRRQNLGRGAAASG